MENPEKKPKKKLIIKLPEPTFKVRYSMVPPLFNLALVGAFLIYNWGVKTGQGR